MGKKKKNQMRRDADETKKSGEELVEALMAETLTKPDEAKVVLVGVVKHSEDDLRTVLFSCERSCDAWIDIPTEMIDDWEHLGQVGCRGHKHPLVRLHLRIPELGENPVAAVFAEVLKRCGAALLRAPSTKYCFRAEAKCDSGPIFEWIHGVGDTPDGAKGQAETNAEAVCQAKHYVPFDRWVAGTEDVHVFTAP